MRWPLITFFQLFYIKTERTKRKKEGKMDSISDRLVHILATSELSPILNQYYDLTYLKLTGWCI